MRLGLLFLLALLLGTTTIDAQRTCHSMEHLEQEMRNNPDRGVQLQKIEAFTRDFERVKELNGGVLTIPVIVHVVWNTNAQNISDAQINSQITVLNDDFRRLNADRNNTPSDFSGVAADTEIEFCLTDIIRVKTRNKRGFGTNDRVKDESLVVNPASTLNIWVCNIGGGILGYAQFPGGSPSTDGVVCDYRYFGTNGTATAPFNLGRTGTHEVGHYLNLRHIWGDGGCGVDDFVSDTPLAGGPNYTGGSCSYPGPNSCSGGLPDMFQNYMDYSDDACMNLFTIGQADRMWAAVNAARPGLLTGSCDGSNPPSNDPEICDNGIDDDGDGQIDCADGDCATAANCDNPPTGGCDAPTGLSHSRAKGGREANLSWNAVSGASSYDVEVYSGGTLIASGTVTGTAATVGGLTKNSPYTWRVRANCGGGEVSPWADGSFNARLAGFDNDRVINAYPNPAGGSEVVVSWDLSPELAPGISEVKTNQAAVTLYLTNISGQLIREIKGNSTTDQMTLQLSDIKAGVYLIRVIGQDGVSGTTKLVKL
ncbi:M43 family zinc metalloprotease [Neolewinella agarilytica]|uniref:M43 family zinc metalloprotease n=1 Tax=Neolewinella agarilytica TaxID=478744 RepID=UPI002355033B|nr:M43 family zinc metalloprotease [Neolewinella agarilytica]